MMCSECTSADESLLPALSYTELLEITCGTVVVTSHGNTGLNLEPVPNPGVKLSKQITCIKSDKQIIEMKLGAPWLLTLRGSCGVTQCTVIVLCVNSACNVINFHCYSYNLKSKVTRKPMGAESPLIILIRWFLMYYGCKRWIWSSLHFRLTIPP